MVGPKLHNDFSLQAITMKMGFIFVLLFPVLLFGQAKRSMRFDPTGSYQLEGKTEERDGETYAG